MVCWGIIHASLAAMQQLIRNHAQEAQGAQEAQEAQEMAKVISGGVSCTNQPTA